MCMENKKIRSAQLVISIAVILRLLVTALASLLLAYAYSDVQDNLSRIYSSHDSVIPIIALFVFGLFLDAALTIVWQYRPKLHTLHLVLYILSGGLFYGFLLIDVLNATGMGALGVLIFMAPCVWLAGLIPFIVCGIGRKKLTKARQTQDQPNMAAF